MFSQPTPASRMKVVPDPVHVEKLPSSTALATFNLQHKPTHDTLRAYKAPRKHIEMANSACVMSVTVLVRATHKDYRGI